MVRKGFAGAALLIAMLIIAAIDISYLYINWGPFNSPEVVRSITLHQEYYTMNNALKLARLYLDTSLRYSVYQAMYDNGYKGGFSEIPEENLHEGNALWYDNGDTYPDEEALLENLKNPALANLGRYLGSDYLLLDNYEVKLPEYTGLVVGRSPEGDMAVNASEDRNLFIKRTMENLDKIELEKNATLSERFGKTYLTLYQKALEKLESIKEKFTEIKNLLGGERTITVEGINVKWDDVRDSALEKAEIMKNNIRPIVNYLQRDEISGNLAIESAVLKEELSVEVDEEARCIKRETEGKGITSMTCSFRYNYEFSVKTKVTDNSGKKYPVFSRKGEVSFEPLTLVFAAREKSK